MTDSKKIEKLTPEQEARIPVIRNKWINIGLSVDPCDRDEAVKWIKLAYKQGGFDPPEHFFFYKSPSAGAIAAMRASEDESLEVIKNTTIEDLVNLTDDERKKCANQLSECGYGNQDADWLSFYDFFKEDLSDTVKRLEPLINLAKHCSWYWPFDKCCLLVERPVYINFDDNKRLHHEFRKALEFGDGEGLYMYHGVRVPADYIEAPEKITKERIIVEKNQEFKRIMLDIYGMVKFLSSEEVEFLHEDRFGKLIAYRGFSPDEEKPDKFVIVKDTSTNREYALGVDPDSVTAKGGIASTFGLTEDEYNPIEEA